jgi:hypothetical protein
LEDCDENETGLVFKMYDPNDKLKELKELDNKVRG